ncbi:MAG: hypothetical protein JW384_01121 [Nitrosomonadaceae bacterium]|nr:hypothetical protein [Nitrosomonadaceae bacterium]
MIEVTSAPVLTLRTSRIAELLGHDQALTREQAVARLSAQTKRWSLRIFEPPPEHIDQKLAYWERFNNLPRPHGAFNGKAPYEALRAKL